MKEHVQLTKAEVQRIDPDILVTKYRPKAEITIEDAREIDNAHITMSQGNDMYIIADMTEGSATVTKEAEEYFVYKGKMIPYTKGVAIVTSSKSSIFSRLFGASTRTLYPTKEFTSVDDARAWLDSIRE
ncbi:MAG: STAS/SEC14 domain-containing protein [Crocinitomicaceae bacterium]|nr:STAS/SEC14 domain-containing protein [Crocinitomicaceae bacterium]